ncbi:DUF1648 domain-containing protein [Kitasatospora sp. NPDC094028]
MTDDKPERGGFGAPFWGAAVWSAGVTALLVALPLAARHRLPERVATHWDGRDPDDSMPLLGAALFPAAVWLVVALAVGLTRRFRPRQSRGWAGPVLAGTGVLLTGAQTSIVHANLDRARWQDAAPMGVEVVAIGAAAGLAVLLTVLATRRHPGERAEPPAGAPVLPLRPGERVAWLSRAANPWLNLAAVLCGLGALGSALAALSGLTGIRWQLVTPFATVAVALWLFASVRVRVSAEGLHVGFGPFGRPGRHWKLAELVSARAERRTALQAGGWGYRVNGLGTTVMVRGGVCLVVRTRRGADFAVSVDDAERGAALLNSLLAQAKAAGAAGAGTHR